CCLLLIAAAQLLQAFRTALQAGADPGLGRPLLVTVESHAGFARGDLAARYFRDVEDAARSLPDVTPTAWMSTMPGGRPSWESLAIEPAHLPLREAVLDVAAFSPPASLALVTLPTIAGRMFGVRDTPHACRVGIVDRQATTDVF